MMGDVLVRGFLRLHISLAALLVPFWDRCFSLNRMLRKYTPRTRFRPYQRVGVETILDMVQRRLRHPRIMKRRACYRRGLLLFYFLRLAGYSPVLHFGVHPPSSDANRLHAHCWISLSGNVLGETTPEIPDMLRYDGGENKGGTLATELGEDKTERFENFGQFWRNS